MKHLRKFENFSDLNMDFPDRLNSQCEKCGQELCNCEPECEPCGDDTNKNKEDDRDWYYFDHPEDMPKERDDDDNDGESYDDEDDEEEGDNYNWGDKNIEIKRESNLITFKDFINEKKKEKGEVPEGLQKYFDEKSGKKAPAKKSKSKSKEDEEENVKPDFLDLNKNGDKKEPMEKAAKEAKEKAAKEAKEKAAKEKSSKK
jgi:hypothetical protein